MAKSWATVARGYEAPAPAPVSSLNPLAAVWKPREVHNCVDCGQLAQTCQNGCDRPGNRSIVPRLGRDRFGQQQWGPRKWVCAGCHYNHDHAISQMPYMDMGPLPDDDHEGKLPFLCIGCADVRSHKEMEESHARYLARKAWEERLKREADAYLATMPKVSVRERNEQIHIAYQVASAKIREEDAAARAAGGGAVQ